MTATHTHIHKYFFKKPVNCLSYSFVLLLRAELLMIFGKIGFKIKKTMKPVAFTSLD